jgi:GNAT superfamily N-acetyltransferase
MELPAGEAARRSLVEESEVNGANTLDRLHQHYARQLGCQPEDLTQGNRQLVTCDTAEGNSALPAAPLRAFRRENGWVVSVTPEAYSSANNVLQNLPVNQDPLSEQGRHRLHETVQKVAPVSAYYYGLELYADEPSFCPFSGHPVHRLTLEDLPALAATDHFLAHMEEEIAEGNLFVAYEGARVCSWAKILRSSDEVWEITVMTDAPYRGRGYAKAVVSAATDAVLKAGRIPVYSCDEYNIASRRVAEALGYRKYADDFVCLGSRNRLD